jgi:hypothetical protein
MLKLVDAPSDVGADLYVRHLAEIMALRRSVAQTIDD